MELLQFALPFWGENEKLPDPELVLFYKGLDSRDIWLDEEITWETCSFIVKYIQYLNTKESFDETPIRLHILSPGGELPIMFTLYETIKNSEIPVHTINEGGCHSAAFIVYLAGTQRSMNTYSTFIAHEGSGMMGGSFRENKVAMRQYEKDVMMMKKIIAENTQLTLEDIENQFEKEQDWYIGYEDACRFGIVTENNK